MRRAEKEQLLNAEIEALEAEEEQIKRIAAAEIRLREQQRRGTRPELGSKKWLKMSNA
jgi:hypothetical protein